MEKEFRIVINHTISGAADIIDLMRRSRPDLHVTAADERTGRFFFLTRWTARSRSSRYGWTARPGSGNGSSFGRL